MRPVGFEMIDKRRTAGVVSSENLVAGEVDGMTALLLDDLIASCDPMKRAALALHQAGAGAVVACAAHGLFVGQAPEALACDSIAEIIVTDSVPPFRLPAAGSARSKLRVVSAAPPFAQVIAASHAVWSR